MGVDREGSSASSERVYGLVGPLVSVPLLALATNACRSCFQSSASTFGSMDPIRTLRVVPAWLRDRITSQVGRFAVSRWADDFVVYSLDLERSVSTDGSNDPVGALRGDFGWPRGVCAL